MFKHPELVNNVIQYTYDIIGNATNIVINTQRSKVPIFVFGAAEAKTISRGQQMITGQIDMVQISESQIDKYLKKQTRKVTALEYEYNKSVYDPGNELNPNTTQSIFGYNSLVSYNVSDTNIDDIHFEEIVLLSTDPQPNKDGTINYLMLTLYNVDFFDYSYAKTINDQQQMERVSFMATGISPIQAYNQEQVKQSESSTATGNTNGNTLNN